MTYITPCHYDLSKQPMGLDGQACRSCGQYERPCSLLEAVLHTQTDDQQTGTNDGLCAKCRGCFLPPDAADYSKPLSALVE